MRLALAAILFASTVAAADDSDLRRPAAATSAAAAFDRAIDATYQDLGNDAVCGKAGCKQEVVSSSTLGDTQVELRKTTSEFGDSYAMVFGHDDTWWATDALIDIEAEDCAMGKCVSGAITSVEISQKGQVAWVTVSVRATIDYHHDHPRRVVHNYQVLLGCKLAAAPTCTRIDAGSSWNTGKATFSGDQVKVDDGGEHRSERASW